MTAMVDHIFKSFPCIRSSDFQYKLGRSQVYKPCCVCRSKMKVQKVKSMLKFTGLDINLFTTQKAAPFMPQIFLLPLYLDHNLELDCILEHVTMAHDLSLILASCFLKHFGGSSSQGLGMDIERITVMSKSYLATLPLF